jgi:hypothetical protein
MPRLTVRKADKARDSHRVLEFRCWPDLVGVEYESGDDGPEHDAVMGQGSDGSHPFWMLEVEEYIRVIMLKAAHHVLVFESDSGELAGVSAFDRQDVSLGRRRVPGWRLEVIALALPWQRALVDADIDGCPPTMRASEYLLRSTFRQMHEIDDRRVLVVGRVHDENRPSMVACARVGLDRQEREDPTSEYWPLLGEVDPAAGPTQ